MSYYKPSDYEKQLKQLEKKKCKLCYGSGERDDAEPGDIYYRTFICPICKGTGLKPEMV